MRCPYCDLEMELVSQYVELDPYDNEYYWECFECGCCIEPAYPTSYDLEALNKRIGEEF